jgi:outer membrane protein OmpA-like peptidoglycan-associated protein
METVSSRLANAQVTGSRVTRKMLSLEIAGTVNGTNMLDQLESELLRNTPFHLPPTKNQLVASAQLDARVEADTLRIRGWLPSMEERDQVLNQFGDMRPDLALDGSGLKISERAALVEAGTGESRPLKHWIDPLIEGILAPAALSIRREGEALIVEGLLPAGPLKPALIDALESSDYDWQVDSEELKTSPYVEDEPFNDPEPLSAFLRSFFDQPTPLGFELGPNGEPQLRGAATHALEARWLKLLRDVTGAAKVQTDFTYHASVYHAPDGLIQSRLAPDFIETLREELAATRIAFPRGSKIIEPEEATKLAALSSILLTAGPALRLVVGGHPDPKGLAGVETSVARLRAEAVLDYLLEMGIPTTHIEAMAFETTSDTSRAGTVEILIQ